MSLTELLLDELSQIGRQIEILRFTATRICSESRKLFIKFPSLLQLQKAYLKRL